MKKVYTINGSEFGIDFNSVLCFYINGDINTYYGKCSKNLIIIVGNKISKPNEIVLNYSNWNMENTKLDGNQLYYDEKINENVDKLYTDLIEYFKHE